MLGAAILLALVGCSTPPDPTATQPQPTTIPPLIPSPTTAPLPSLVLVAETEPEWAPALEDWAASMGWQLSQVDGAGAVAEVPSDVKAIIAVGNVPGDEAPTFAQEGIAVVEVDAPDATPGPWLSTVGEPGARHDQAAFLAGIMTGLASQSLWVGEITDTGGANETIHRAGFNQGLRYGCPKCQLVSFSAAETTLDGFRGKGVDVVFPHPGPSATEAAQLLADGGLALVWVGEYGLPTDILAGRVLSEPGTLVISALEALLRSGEGRAWPYSIENGSLSLVDINELMVSPGRQRLLQEAYEAIAVGELDIGLDPETGEPR